MVYNNKEYRKEYYSRPSVKERRKEYYSRPEVIARTKISQRNYRQKNPGVFARGAERHRAKFPKKTWAARVIASHRQRGFKVMFSVISLTKNIALLKNCPVCGKTIDWLYKRTPTQQGPGLVCPSLDNLDNSRVLTLKNIKVMCFQCNVGKSTGTLDEYIQHCKNVVSYRPTKPTPL